MKVIPTFDPFERRHLCFRLSLEPTKVQQLRDPGDELVLEAAANGGANAIVTVNQRDFGEIPLRFGVKVLAPADVLRRIKS